MRVTELLQSSYYTFNQSPDNERFNHDFLMSLNEGLNEFANLRKWGCLRTKANVVTVEDTETASLPSNFGTPYNIRGAHRITSPAGSADEIITIVSPDQQYSRHYTTETGTPERAWIMGTNLYFSPIPDAAYTISFQYYKRPAAITSNSGDISDPPARYHELIKVLTFRRLQVLGYTADREIAISDTERNRLYAMMIKDDVATYGGMTVALYDDSYTNEVG